MQLTELQFWLLFIFCAGGQPYAALVVLAYAYFSKEDDDAPKTK